MTTSKHGFIMILLISFTACSNNKESDELVTRSIKNPTPLQRACKDYIYQTPPYAPIPITDSVLNGRELSLCVSLLAGADPHQKNDKGKSLLQMANEITDSRKRARIVEILKAAGAK